MKNPLNHPRVLRAIALLFLGLVLVGVAVGLVRSFLETNTNAVVTRTVVVAPRAPGRR